MISKCIQHTAQGPSAHQGLMYPECARIAMFSTESLDWIGLGLEIAPTLWRAVSHSFRTLCGRITEINKLRVLCTL